MFKKAIIILLTIGLVFMAVGCNGGSDDGDKDHGSNNSNPAPAPQPSPQPEPEEPEPEPEPEPQPQPAPQPDPTTPVYNISGTWDFRGTGSSSTTCNWQTQAQRDVCLDIAMQLREALKTPFRERFSQYGNKVVLSEAGYSLVGSVSGRNYSFDDSTTKVENGITMTVLLDLDFAMASLTYLSGRVRYTYQVHDVYGSCAITLPFTGSRASYSMESRETPDVFDDTLEYGIEQGMIFYSK